MRRVLVTVAFFGLLIPAIASAEFNYNAVDVGYATTPSDIDNPYKELGVGISKSISGNTYLGGSFVFGKLNSKAGLGDTKVYSVSARAGYHQPLSDRADVIVEGRVVFGTSYQTGNSVSANGYDFGAGIRKLFIPGFEGTLGLFHAKKFNGTLSRIDTYLKAQLGFNFTPKYQLTAGIDFKPDFTTYMGMRIYY
jgi:hypothetical protein